MPVIPSTYRGPAWWPQRDMQTLWPTFFGPQRPHASMRRERITTPDGDFLDLDWTDAPSGKSGSPPPASPRRLAVITHGLEGSSRSPYVLSVARGLGQAGWDVIAWNFRGCSGETNRRPCLYHSGVTHDLEHVLEHAYARGGYEDVALIGFSLGGNLTLRYAGEQGAALDPRIRHAIAFCAPVDLAAGARRLEQRRNSIYLRYFLKRLCDRVNLRRAELPDWIDHVAVAKAKTFQEFDDLVTAPLHGFADAADYYARCSARQFLSGLTIPSLIVNPRNDPFLTPECYPWEEAETNPHLYLEVPRKGGHCGFPPAVPGGACWLAKRSVEFLRATYPEEKPRARKKLDDSQSPADTSRRR